MSEKQTVDLPFISQSDERLRQHQSLPFFFQTTCAAAGCNNVMIVCPCDCASDSFCNKCEAEFQEL